MQAPIRDYSMMQYKIIHFSISNIVVKLVDPTKRNITSNM